MVTVTKSAAAIYAEDPVQRSEVVLYKQEVEQAIDQNAADVVSLSGSLGSAATLNAGVSAGEVFLIPATLVLPPFDGSQLTNVQATDARTWVNESANRPWSPLATPQYFPNNTSVVWDVTVSASTSTSNVTTWQIVLGDGVSFEDVAVTANRHPQLHFSFEVAPGQQYGLLWSGIAPSSSIVREKK